MDDINIDDSFIFFHGIILFYSVYQWLKRRDRPRRDRRFFCRAENLDRTNHGFFKTCFQPIKKNEEEFFKMTRMPLSLYNILLSFLEKKITKKPTRFTIVPEARLALTLLHLAQGTSHQVLGWSFKIGRSTVREIILETCSIIWEVLSPLYVCKPTSEDFQLIADDFQNLWDLPHCVGALDGKHIAVEAPAHSGSQYYNYKNFFSIVLFAACDAKYTFTMVDIGAYGSQSDGGILAESVFGKELFSGQLPLPSDSKIPNTSLNFPYFFIGDPAFPLRNNLMRPYPGKLLTREKKVYNYRISRARACIENTFGILVSRWRILRSTMMYSPENAEKIVLATIALHNFIRLNSKTFSSYCPPSYVDTEDHNGNVIPGRWREDINIEEFARVRLGSNNATRNAFQLRDKLRDYFLHEGAITKQNKIQ